MRALLSTIGSRGDVQPLLALALELRALGHEARLCAPPDFGAWVEGLGFGFVPIGPEVRRAATAPRPAGRPTPEQLRQLAEATVSTQFATLPEAAEGCDVLVGATALQLAARSVAERLGLPYVYVGYCPAGLPNPLVPPAPTPMYAAAEDEPAARLWERDAEHWDAMWGAALNGHRAALGLPPVEGVRDHLFTDRPWLAADPVLGPWPGGAELEVWQSGAWLLPDARPLPPELAGFLDAGEPPVYVGFGSMALAPETGEAVLAAVRESGRRMVVLRGWAGLTPGSDGPDRLTVEEVNQTALFRRVAAVVHHGGAGTTTAAALAGAPQVIVPQSYDQHYWGRRVAELGVGGTTTPEGLAGTLAGALKPETAERARALAARMPADAAATAARKLGGLAR
ncbi:glycosyltransferase [Nonomuraea sp. NPDC050328]|uniref:glycosyltransferase n=1 Tax=Nonomuraea sp. NPDC050328 TaxID=3364361 RepID=UPI0037B99DE7